MKNQNEDARNSYLSRIRPMVDLPEPEHSAQRFAREWKEKNPNKFPIDAFPEPVQEIILATHECLNFPIEFISSSILYAASIAIGNSHRVCLKDSFLENAVLYLVLIGSAGTNKSQPLKFALKPIMDADNKSYAEYLKDLTEYEKFKSLSVEQKKEMKTDEMPKPIWKVNLMQDYTPEKLVDVHNINKRGLGVYSDEFAGWIKNFNRYSKGSEMEFWLSAWSKTPLRVDRLSSSAKNITMPFISVAGTIQSKLLQELAKDNKKDNGFLDRVLKVFPDNLVKPYWNDIEIDPKEIKNWNNIVSFLLKLDMEVDENYNPKPKILKFSDEALVRINDWHKLHTDFCNEEEDEAVKSIFSKFDIYVLRFSLILEMLSYACSKSAPKNISITSLEGAISLVKYFKTEALKVNTYITSNNPLDHLPENKKMLYNSLEPKFKTESALARAKIYGISDRSCKTFISKKELFKKDKHGYYSKIL